MRNNLQFGDEKESQDEEGVAGVRKEGRKESNSVLALRDA